MPLDATKDVEELKLRMKDLDEQVRSLNAYLVELERHMKSLR